GTLRPPAKGFRLDWEGAGVARAGAILRDSLLWRLSCVRWSGAAGHGKGGARVVRDYELMYIVRPDLDDEGLRGAMAAVESLVEGQGGEVVKTTSWGKRRLAYEIQNLRDGHYVI